MDIGSCWRAVAQQRVKAPSFSRLLPYHHKSWTKGCHCGCESCDSYRPSLLSPALNERFPGYMDWPQRLFFAAFLVLAVAIDGTRADAMLSGNVFCDQCKDGQISLFDYPVYGVRVELVCTNSNGQVTMKREEVTNLVGSYVMRFDGVPNLSSCRARVSGRGSTTECGLPGGPAQSVRLAFRILDLEMYTVGSLLAQPSQPAAFCPRSAIPLPGLANPSPGQANPYPSHPSPRQANPYPRSPYPTPGQANPYPEPPPYPTPGQANPYPEPPPYPTPGQANPYPEPPPYPTPGQANPYPYPEPPPYSTPGQANPYPEPEPPPYSTPGQNPYPEPPPYSTPPPPYSTPRQANHYPEPPPYSTPRQANHYPEPPPYSMPGQTNNPYPEPPPYSTPGQGNPYSEPPPYSTPGQDNPYSEPPPYSTPGQTDHNPEPPLYSTPGQANPHPGPADLVPMPPIPILGPALPYPGSVNPVPVPPSPNPGQESPYPGYVNPTPVPPSPDPEQNDPYSPVPVNPAPLPPTPIPEQTDPNPEPVTPVPEYPNPGPITPAPPFRLPPMPPMPPLPFLQASVCSHQNWTMPEYRCYWRALNPDMKVTVIFGSLAGRRYGTDMTLEQGLEGRGDPYQTLLREGITALLNSYHNPLFQFSPIGVVQHVNWALMGSSRQVLLTGLDFIRANSGSAVVSCRFKPCK